MKYYYSNHGVDLSSQSLKAPLHHKQSMALFISISISFALYLFACLSAYLSICVSVYLRVCLGFCFYFYLCVALLLDFSVYETLKYFSSKRQKLRQNKIKWMHNNLMISLCMDSTSVMWTFNKNSCLLKVNKTVDKNNTSISLLPVDSRFNKDYIDVDITNQWASFRYIQFSPLYFSSQFTSLFSVQFTFLHFNSIQFNSTWYNSIQLDQFNKVCVNYLHLLIICYSAIILTLHNSVMYIVCYPQSY